MGSPSSGVTFSSLIVEALTRYQHREAFVCGSRRVTYAEAAERTAHLTTTFAGMGVRLGSGVALLSSNSPESWLAQAATYLLGGHFSGLQLLGSLDDHVFVCDDAEVSVLVVGEDHDDQGSEILAQAATVKHLVILRSDGTVEGGNAPGITSTLTAGPAGEEDVAWLQYTGGTTGRPKGAMLPQRAMAQQAMSVLASWGLPEHLVIWPPVLSRMRLSCPCSLRCYAEAASCCYPASSPRHGSVQCMNTASTSRSPFQR